MIIRAREKLFAIRIVNEQVQYHFSLGSILTMAVVFPVADVGIKFNTSTHLLTILSS